MWIYLKSSYIYLCLQQKIVLKVILSDQKLYTKALKLAVSIPGVTAVALEGCDKLTVCGEGVDVATLVMKIRDGTPKKKCKWWKFCTCCEPKKGGGVGLVLVESVAEDKPEEKKKEKKPCLYPPFQYEVIEAEKNPNHFFPENSTGTFDGAGWPWNMWQLGQC